MGTDFRIKLITNGRYSTTANVFIKSLMENRFIYPTKQSESEIIIRGFCEGNNVYLDIHQNVDIFSSRDELINILKQEYNTEHYSIGYNKDCNFYDEFIFSGSAIENVEGGVENFLRITKEMNMSLTDEEKKIKYYKEFKNSHDKILSESYNSKDFNNYLNAIAHFLKHLAFDSHARILLWSEFSRIHTDKYSAQEHFKEIIKPIHMKLKQLGFKKKAFKFILFDQKNNIEKEILLQKHWASRKEGITFTVRFCVRPIGKENIFVRWGILSEKDLSGCYKVNISINTEETKKQLELYIDAILMVLMNCNSYNEYEEFYESQILKMRNEWEVKRIN